MKTKNSAILLLSCLVFSSCSEFNQITEYKSNVSKPSPIFVSTKKQSTSKKYIESKKDLTKNNITGILSSGVEFEAIADAEGFVISFDPFIPKKDEVFEKATNQIIGKLYNDKTSDESHISIESDIDYTIMKGLKSRYRIVPFKESSGEISSITITSIQ